VEHTELVTSNTDGSPMTLYCPSSLGLLTEIGRHGPWHRGSNQATTEGQTA
jgi:hypothetical protein